MRGSLRICLAALMCAAFNATPVSLRERAAVNVSSSASKQQTQVMVNTTASPSALPVPENRTQPRALLPVETPKTILFTIRPDQIEKTELLDMNGGYLTPTAPGHNMTINESVGSATPLPIDMTGAYAGVSPIKTIN